MLLYFVLHIIIFLIKSTKIQFHLLSISFTIIWSFNISYHYFNYTLKKQEKETYTHTKVIQPCTHHPNLPLIVKNLKLDLDLASKQICIYTSKNKTPLREEREREEGIFQRIYVQKWIRGQLLETWPGRGDAIQPGNLWRRAVSRPRCEIRWCWWPRTRSPRSPIDRPLSDCAKTGRL